MQVLPETMHKIDLKRSYKNSAKKFQIELTESTTTDNKTYLYMLLLVLISKKKTKNILNSI